MGDLRPIKERMRPVIYTNELGVDVTKWKFTNKSGREFYIKPCTYGLKWQISSVGPKLKEEKEEYMNMEAAILAAEKMLRRLENEDAASNNNKTK